MLSKPRPSARWRTGTAAAAPVLFSLLIPGATRGEGPGDPVTVTINATADTGLLELSPEFDFNLGNQRDVPAGTLGPMVGEPRSRMLLRFSVAEQIPAGATITTATARLTVVREPAGAQDGEFHLHRLNRDWTEGAGSGDNPGGRPALPGETTWNQLHHGDPPDDNWTSPGGLAGSDFTATPSATSPVVSSLIRYSFAFSPAGVSEIQEMLDQPCTDHGWILISDREETAKSARRWATRENRDADAVPSLTLTYLPPPAPTSVTSLELDPAGTTATLTYLATAGVSYRLEASPDLRSPCWNILSTSPPAPTDGPQSFTAPTNNASHLFYRILAFCPLPQD